MKRTFRSTTSKAAFASPLVNVVATPLWGVWLGIWRDVYRTAHSAGATAPRTYEVVFLVICFLMAGQLSNGAPLRSARVSAVIRDVRLLPSNAAPRPAAVNENVGLGTAVRTGTESRAELTFADLTVTRLGENTIFSFNEAARELNVTKGAILVEVPSKAPAAKITTAGVTAGVMGGTALFATGPPIKFMVLEGIGTFYPTGHPERIVTVHAGEMVTMTADGRILSRQSLMCNSSSRLRT